MPRSTQQGTRNPHMSNSSSVHKYYAVFPLIDKCGNNQTVKLINILIKRRSMKTNSSSVVHASKLKTFTHICQYDQLWKDYFSALIHNVIIRV